MNYIWAGMILVSLVVAFFNGTLNETVAAGMEGAKGSVEAVLSFAGVMCLWSGLIKMADAGGVTAVLEKLLRPVTGFLFPRLSKNCEALQKITVNMTANLLGMGNAATPAGIAAMGALDKLNPNPKYASDEMCMFVVLNTASIQLVPSTILALRMAAGSADPFGIIVPVWIASFTALFAAVLFMKLVIRFKGAKK